MWLQWDRVTPDGETVRDGPALWCRPEAREAGWGPKLEAAKQTDVTAALSPTGSMPAPGARSESCNDFQATERGFPVYRKWPPSAPAPLHSQRLWL